MTGYDGRHVLVAGAGMAGAASARALLAAGARVTVLDRKDSAELGRLREAGASVLIGDLVGLAGIDDVVLSPGFAPHTPLARAAVAAGLPVYSEPELAWRMRGPDAPPWLALTGTNGKTTAVTMLAAMLRAAGLRAAALGNVGEPLVGAHGYDVVAVELSSFQLYWSSTIAPAAGAILNLADDHLEWHGSREAYGAAKLKIWVPGALAVGNLDDAWVSAALASAPGRAVGVTLGEPKPGQLGVIDGFLVDRAFADGDEPEARGSGRDHDGGRSPSAGATDGIALAPAEGIRPSGLHNVSNALHAAALARAHGVGPAAIAAGLAGYEPEPHRNALVATVDGVAYVNDSKATNPHAAFASLSGYPRVVWIAGGQLKGVDVAELVAAVAGRLTGAVLLGVDRAEVAAALARHAPEVPVVDVARTDDGAMADVVRAAAALAKPGDTVLLAPAAASKDMFTGYPARGEAFARAVRELPG